VDTSFTEPGSGAADQGLVAAMRESAAGQNMTVNMRSHPQSILAGALAAAVWGGRFAFGSCGRWS